MTDRSVSFLLVDDDEVDVSAVRRAFRKAHNAHPLVVAADGVEALDHLRGTGGKPRLASPYVILLDLHMPRMSGREFLQELRDDPDHCDAVVFALTSSKDERQKDDIYGFKVAGYFVKSGEMDDFVELARMLKLYGQLAELPGEGDCVLRRV
jgi:CheY-like chemotaxis protein